MQTEWEAILNLERPSPSSVWVSYQIQNFVIQNMNLNFMLRYLNLGVMFFVFHLNAYGRILKGFSLRLISNFETLIF